MKLILQTPSYRGSSRQKLRLTAFVTRRRLNSGGEVSRRGKLEGFLAIANQA
jgi:hypothetical protein